MDNIILIKKLIEINQHNLFLEENISGINKYITELRNYMIELKYKPGGSKYIKIKSHYESLINQ